MDSQSKNSLLEEIDFIRKQLINEGKEINHAWDVDINDSIDDIMYSWKRIKARYNQREQKNDIQHAAVAAMFLVRRIHKIYTDVKTE